MRASLIVALVVAILAVVFALQNPHMTRLAIGPYDMQGSVALVTLITFALGVITGVLVSVPSVYRARKAAKKKAAAPESPAMPEYTPPPKSEL